MLSTRAVLRHVRRCSTQAQGVTLAVRMERELGSLFEGAASRPPAMPGQKGGRSDFSIGGLRRKMPDHELPAYAEANFRTLTFVLTRAPRQADFPKEMVYRRESLDLLYRHYYMNP